MNSRRFAAMAIAGFLVLLGHLQSWQPSAMAQMTNSERAFVYGINAAVPDNFLGTFAPPTAETIFLLADGTSVISPRYTEIYFWPITNEYRANWSALNEPVPACSKSSKMGVSSPSSPRPTTRSTSSKRGHHDRRAFPWSGCRRCGGGIPVSSRSIPQGLVGLSAGEQAWLDAMAEVNSRQQAGETVEVPPEPVRPEPIGIFSNGLNSGFPIDLDPGQYDIRLRGSDGTVVPESERAMIIFAPRRTGVGYTIVPETRWTTPLESSAPSDVIFGAPDSALYLEPHLAREYPARTWGCCRTRSGYRRTWRLGVGQWREARRPAVGDRCR